jgi:hypothetical protein
MQLRTNTIKKHLIPGVWKMMKYLLLCLVVGNLQAQGPRARNSVIYDLISN